MPQQYPKKLPPKGKGRVDNKHQIALLTDFEVAALNTLKNRDKDRGFSSGSGPEIKALAAQNSRPFEFVNYRGERIPSLNDFSEGGYGGGGDAGSDAGEQEARDQTASGGDYGQKNDWAAQERRRKREEERLKREREWAAQQERLAKERAADIKKINQYVDYYRKKSGEFYGDGFIQDDFDDTDEGFEGTKPGDEFYGEEYPEKKPPEDYGDGPTTPRPDDDDEPPMSKEEFEALLEEHDIPTFEDSEGGIHLSQEEADAASVGYGKRDLLGGAEGFEYGSAVTDEEGTATDKTLTGTYRGAYEQMLADAYDAAKTGVGSGLASSGGLPTFDDAGNEIDPYAALESAVEGQGTYLDTLASNYQDEAQGRYDDWLATNTANINALKTLEDIEGYTWTDMPEYDTDWSGGYNEAGEWDEDWMPEFYSGFDKEYGKDYLGSDSWQYDDQGNVIPGSYSPATTGTTPPEEEETTTTSRSTSRMAPGIQPGKRGGSGVSQFGRSAARYI